MILPTWLWAIGTPALATFYFVVRRYTLLFRAGKLGKDWDPIGIFVFGIIMGIIWPLTLIWAVARRPSRQEKEIAREDRLRRLALENERRAKELGIGDVDG